MNKRISFILFVLFAMSLGCSHSPPPPHENARLEIIFQRWEEGIEAELRDNKNWVAGPLVERKYLAGQVTIAPSFFLEKLKKNMFVVLILDESELRKGHEDQLDGTEGMQSRQQVWMSILEK
jgi:hypothetical protein